MLRITLATLLFSFGTLAAAAPASYFSSQLSKAKAGDYIVASQPGNYSILIVQARDKDKIVLEEIDVPDYAVDGKKIDWKTWVLSKAPGHSSWVMLEIDLTEAKLSRAYSWTKRSFLHISPDEQLLLQLLSLPTQRLSVEDRRKIGPPPLAGEVDRRPIWQPPVSLEGSSRKDPTSVYRAEWPHDKSLLAGSKIDLFFTDTLSDFPFPIWIEIYGGHFKTRLAVVDAGRNLFSPAPKLPHRPPEIVKMPKKEGDKFVVVVRCPESFEKLELYALEASGPLRPGVRLLHTMERIDAETVRLIIPATLVDDRLESGHRYRLALMPSGHRECYTETTESFLIQQ